MKSTADAHSILQKEPLEASSCFCNSNPLELAMKPFEVLIRTRSSQRRIESPLNAAGDLAESRRHAYYAPHRKNLHETCDGGRPSMSSPAI